MAGINSARISCFFAFRRALHFVCRTAVAILKIASFAQTRLRAYDMTFRVTTATIARVLRNTFVASRRASIFVFGLISLCQRCKIRLLLLLLSIFNPADIMMGLGVVR